MPQEENGLLDSGWAALLSDPIAKPICLINLRSDLGDYHRQKLSWKWVKYMTVSICQTKWVEQTSFSSYDPHMTSKIAVRALDFFPFLPVHILEFNLFNL